MVRKGLYEELSSIMSIYSNEYEINEYNHPEIKEMFECSSPTIKIKKQNDYIGLSFNGIFPYYLSDTNEKYLIKVLKNDKVVHDLSFERRKLLNKIIGYVENDIYEEAQLNSIREIERKLKEMRKDPIFEKYKNMSKEILYKLGYTYRTDDMLDHNASVTEACTYNDYGLTISAYDLPGYGYKDERNGGLQSFIKDYMDKIRISYKGREVFNTEKEKYEKGIWEEILKEVYNKTGILKAKKEASFQKKKHCEELMNEVIMPICYKGVRQVNNSLKIGYYTSESSTINNCGSHETDYHYTVTKDNQEVFHAIRTNWSRYSFDTYIAGSWENELKEFLVNYEIIKKQKDEKDGLEYLKRLKNLR